MPDAIVQFNMATFLSQPAFRCPDAITTNVHWHVPDIRSAKVGGIVAETSIHQRTTPVIRRYNAPLIALAMDLLSQGHKVDVAG